MYLKKLLILVLFTSIFIGCGETTSSGHYLFSNEPSRVYVAPAPPRDKPKPPTNLPKPPKVPKPKR